VRHHEDQCPLYSADGTPLGFRSLEATKRLLAGGFVTPAYGRKGHLKAVFLRRGDGSTPVEALLRVGTRYSFREHLESGKSCWRLKRIGVGAELRPLFLRVVTDCLADG
jgi:hypothetical protein